MEETLYKKGHETLSTFSKIEKWGEERNFYGEGGATVEGQFVKLNEEIGELAGNIARDRDYTDESEI